MSIPFCDTLEEGVYLLVPAALYEGRERPLSDAVGGGGGCQPCRIKFEPMRKNA